MSTTYNAYTNMKKKTNLIIKIILNVVGTVSLALGVIGIFLPLLPTTPFLLLASLCYVKGSKKLYNKLMTNKYLGPYIKGFKNKQGMPLKAKYYSIILLWVSLGISMYLYMYNNVILFILSVIGVSVSILIFKMKTLNKEANTD